MRKQENEKQKSPLRLHKAPQTRSCFPGLSLSCPLTGSQGEHSANMPLLWNHLLSNGGFRDLDQTFPLPRLSLSRFSICMPVWFSLVIRNRHAESKAHHSFPILGCPEREGETKTKKKRLFLSCLLLHTIYSFHLENSPNECRYYWLHFFLRCLWHVLMESPPAQIRLHRRDALTP